MGDKIVWIILIIFIIIFIWVLFQLRNYINTKSIEINNEDIEVIPNPYSEFIPYSEYEKYINSVNPFDLDLTDISDRELTAAEKCFLKILNSRPVENPGIAHYWYYRYGIKFEEILKLYFKKGLLGIQEINYLETCTIPVLKSILETKNLKKSGKKSELIERILKNFSESEIEKIECKKIYEYVLTDKGKDLIDNLPESISCDTELREACVNLILAHKENEAYKRVCEFEISAPLPRGLFIGMDDARNHWREELKKDWAGRKLSGSTEEEQVYSACSIYCEMMGQAYSKVNIVAKACGIEPNINLENWLYRERSSFLNLKEIEELKTSNIAKYRILSACDLKTCKKCAHMDGKIFNVLEAVIGYNLPPFCDRCRCGIAAYDSRFNTKDNLRRVRSNNGKSILVPFMDYKKWSRTYAPEKYIEYFKK